MFIAALVYVYNQFLPLPNIIEIIAQVSWIGVHGRQPFYTSCLFVENLGDTPIVYLLLNVSLRKAVFKMVMDGTKKCATKTPFVSKIIKRATINPEGIGSTNTRL
jgi:hypothetical protein